MDVSFENCDIEQLGRFFFPADRVFPADLAIVFGMTAWQAPLARALALYRQHLVGKLLFTGGFNARIQTEEGTAMARAALGAGVPESDILVDRSSTNTMENVVNAYRLIERAMGIDEVTTILVVAIHFHMRRVLMTVERTFPARIRVGCASYPSAAYSGPDWHLSDKGREDVFSEAAKIEQYFGCRVPGISVKT